MLSSGSQSSSEGKIKYIGISECSSATLRRAYALHQVAAMRVEYNSWDLDSETEAGTRLLHICQELGVAITGTGNV